MNIVKYLVCVLICILTSLGNVNAQSASQDRFSVSGAANTTSWDVDNPYYLLRIPAVQELAYEARLGPLRRNTIAERLSGTEAKLENLVATDILHPISGGRYALAMNVVDVEDKLLVRKVANPAGHSLAEAILARRDEFDSILSEYDLEYVDHDLLMMALLGCAVLDWDGLGVTADEGYRQIPKRKPNGSKYQVTMQENAPGLSIRALYWGSHNNVVADGSIVVSTFGDHEHLSRLGFPDVKTIIDSGDIKDNGVTDELAKAVSSIYASAMNEHESLSAELMIALREGPATKGALNERIEMDQGKIARSLRVLAALNYIEQDGEYYRTRVPVFTVDKDTAMLDAFRALGKEVMSAWLKENYEPVKQDLSELKAVKAGVPYDIVYTQLWHDIFGWANYHLVQMGSGYVYDPYGPDAEFVAFVPFVWEFPMMLFEGTRIF